MIPIVYRTGDATNPTDSGINLVCHVCNNKGGWGRGFVVAISKKWNKPEVSYRDWARLCQKNGTELPLGKCQFVWCDSQTVVVNMIAQNGYSKPNKPAFDIKSFEECLKEVCGYAKNYLVTVNMPRIGIGLGGFPSWEPIEEVIEKQLSAHNINVVIYDLPNK